MRYYNNREADPQFQMQNGYAQGEYGGNDMLYNTHCNNILLDFLSFTVQARMHFKWHKGNNKWYALLYYIIPFAQRLH